MAMSSICSEPKSVDVAILQLVSVPSAANEPSMVRMGRRRIASSRVCVARGRQESSTAGRIVRSTDTQITRRIRAVTDVGAAFTATEASREQECCGIELLHHKSANLEQRVPPS